MASVDEAYLDLTGTERLHGPALARPPTPFMKQFVSKQEARAQMLRSESPVHAWSPKVSTSDQAKPNGVSCIVPPGEEARFLAPLEVRKSPRRGQSHGKPKPLHSAWASAASVEIWLRSKGIYPGVPLRPLGIRACPAKRRGSMPAAWFDAAIGERGDPKSISHEHTFNDRHEDPRLNSNPL